MSMTPTQQSGATTYKVFFQKVEAKLGDYIVFTAEDFRNSPSNPPSKSISNTESGQFVECILFHDLEVDFTHVDLLVELRWKLGLPKQLLIHCVGHCEWYAREENPDTRPNATTKRQKCRDVKEGGQLKRGEVKSRLKLREAAHDEIILDMKPEKELLLAEIGRW